MTTLLICPSERQGFGFLTERLPLSNVPLLGQSLLEYWLSALAMQSSRQVLVLAHDRPELVQDVVQEGQRWGLTTQVLTESRELTPAEALLKYATQLEAKQAQDSIHVMNYFPGQPDRPIFAGCHHFFAALRDWMPAALTVDRVGINEIHPGVWMGCHSHVSPQAKLRGPCWIGQNVFVGAGAVIGPGAILEDGSFIEPGAELAESWVGPDTFVGEFACLANSLAWGASLVNWQTGSSARVADPFLMCALRQPRRARSLGWFNKLTDLYARNKGEVGLLWRHLLLHKES